jgi:hypothetical protein
MGDPDRPTGQTPVLSTLSGHTGPHSSSVRMAAGESHRGVFRRVVDLSTIAGWGEVSPPSAGVGTFPELFLGFGEAERP